MNSNSTISALGSDLNIFLEIADRFAALPPGVRFRIIVFCAQVSDGHIDRELKIDLSSNAAAVQMLEYLGGQVHARGIAIDAREAVDILTQ